MIDASRVHTADTAAVTVTRIGGVPNFDIHVNIVISEESNHVLAFHMVRVCLNLHCLGTSATIASLGVPPAKVDKHPPHWLGHFHVDHEPVIIAVTPPIRIG